MILYENASDDLIMHEHVCDENAWECMRTYENDAYSWRGVLLIYGWVALYDMHDNEWECMRMTENDWESLIFKELLLVIPCWFTLYDMHENVWECTRLSHNAWACMWWECMRMTENVRETLIFREGWWVILGRHTLYDMNDNEW